MAMAVAVANSFHVLSSRTYLEGRAVRENRELVAYLCRQFYTLGWVSGTGGSITIKVHDESIPKPDQLIAMSPSGVQKERMVPECMYVISGVGEMLPTPCPKPYPNKSPKCSDCAPLFMKEGNSEKERNRRDMNLGELRRIEKKVSFLHKNYYYNEEASQTRNAGAVIHSHGMESCIVTMINPFSKEFQMF